MVTGNLSENVVARAQRADLAADLLNSPRYFGAEDPLARLPKSTDPNVSQFSGHCFSIGSIDRRGDHPDQHLAIGWRGLGDLLDTNYIRRTLLGANNGLHRPRIVWIISAGT